MRMMPEMIIDGVFQSNFHEHQWQLAVNANASQLNMLLVKISFLILLINFRYVPLQDL